MEPTYWLVAIVVPSQACPVKRPVKRAGPTQTCSMDSTDAASGSGMGGDAFSAVRRRMSRPDVALQLLDFSGPLCRKTLRRGCGVNEPGVGRFRRPIGGLTDRKGGRRAARCICILCLVVIAAACSTTTTNGRATPSTTGPDGQEGRSGGIFRIGLSEPDSLDPGLSDSTGVPHLLFASLVNYDGNPELRTGPGVAERWEPNDDCTQWTFHLRKSTFSNGEPVTAASFILGWTRAVDAKAVSKVAYHLSGVQGYAELHGSEGVAASATAFSGLSAPDPQTFLVRLTAPDCEFDKKTLAPVASPIPSTAGPADGKAFAEAPVGDGPFMLKPGTKWEHDQGFTLVRNDTYFGHKPYLDGIEYKIFPAQNASRAVYTAFEAGEVDMAIVPAALRPQADAAYSPQGAFVKIPVYTTSSVAPNDAKGPLRDPDARRAVSLAIDREAINKGLSQGYFAPATSLIPPAFGAYWQAGVCDACRFDPAQAKQLAAKTGLTPGTHLKLVYGGGSPDLAQALKGQLESTLGVVVDLEGPPTSALYLAKAQAGDFDLLQSVWTADYPSADNFLFPLLHHESKDDVARYNNPEFEALIRQERAQRDAGDRVRLVQAAERLAIGRDVALLPLLYSSAYFVFDAKKWAGLPGSFFGSVDLTAVHLK